MSGASSTAPTVRRLALVGHRLGSPSATGVGRYYREIIGGIAPVAAAHGYEVVAATMRERHDPGWLPPAVERLTIPGPRKLRTLAWSAIGLPRADRALGHPALVHALHAWAPVPTSAPLVVTLHDLMPLRHPEWYPRVERWSFGRAVARAADSASMVIADSATEAANLVDQGGFGPDRIRVVPLGVGAEFRAPRERSVEDEACARQGVERHRYLVALGAVTSRKNLGVVLQALARTSPDLLGKTALLVIGPPGADAETIHSQAGSLGVADRVRFAGYVPGDDLPALLGASLMLVHPSVDEGFGLTPLEAMASGTAALVAASGSLPEVVGSAALLADPHDPDPWAEAIARVATDGELRSSLLNEGRRHQAQFTWARTAEETLAVYDELLGTA